MKSLIFSALLLANSKDVIANIGHVGRHSELAALPTVTKPVNSTRNLNSVATEDSVHALHTRSENLYALRIPLDQQAGYIALYLPNTTAVPFCKSVPKSLFEDSLDTSHNLILNIAKSALEILVREDRAIEFCRNVSQHEEPVNKSPATASNEGTSRIVMPSAPASNSTKTRMVTAPSLSETLSISKSSIQGSSSAISTGISPTRSNIKETPAAGKSSLLDSTSSQPQETTVVIQSTSVAPSLTTISERTTIVILSTSTAPSLRLSDMKANVKESAASQPPQKSLVSLRSVTHEKPLSIAKGLSRPTVAAAATPTMHPQEKPSLENTSPSVAQSSVSQESMRPEIKHSKENIESGDLDVADDNTLEVAEIDHQMVSPRKAPNEIVKRQDSLNQLSQSNRLKPTKSVVKKNVSPVENWESDEMEILPLEPEKISSTTLTVKGTTSVLSSVEDIKFTFPSSADSSEDDEPLPASTSRAPAKTRPGSTTTDDPTLLTSPIQTRRPKSSSTEDQNITQRPVLDKEPPSPSCSPPKPAKSQSTSLDFDTTLDAGTATTTLEPHPPRPTLPSQTKSHANILTWHSSCSIATTTVSPSNPAKPPTTILKTLGCYRPLKPSDSKAQVQPPSPKNKQEGEAGGGGGKAHDTGVESAGSENDVGEEEGGKDAKSEASAAWGKMHDKQIAGVVYALWGIVGLQVIVGGWNFGLNVWGSCEVLGIKG